MTNLFQYLIQQISDSQKQHTKDGGSVCSYVHTFGDRGLLEAYSYRLILAIPIVPIPAVKNGISLVQEGLP